MPKKIKEKKTVAKKDVAFAAGSSKISEDDFSKEASSDPAGVYDPFFLADVLLKFGMILTGMPLYFYQRAIAWRIFLAVLRFEGGVLTVLLSRQCGKSECVAVVIDTLTVLMPVLAKVKNADGTALFPQLEEFKGGYHIGLFAPQSDQVWTTYNRSMLRLGSENAAMILADPDIDVSLESQVHLNLDNGSKLVGQIASKQSKIESATYHIVFAEEAQDIEDFIINKSISPMLTATGGTLVKVGTTGTQKNHFYEDIKINRNRDRKIADDRTHLHWEYDYKQVIKYRQEQFDIDKKDFHLRYQKFIQDLINRYGTQTEEFKLSYALIWSLESGMLMTEKDWERITNKKLGLDNYKSTDVIVAGWDIAKKINSSVLTIGKVIDDTMEVWEKPKKQIIAWFELIGMDYEAQHHAILDLLVQYNVRRLAGDYTGVGVAVLDRLMYACGDQVDIIPFTFSRQSKSEMWYAFTSDIATGRLIVPARKEVKGTVEYHNFEEQMMNCQKYYEGSYLVCEKSEGFFDDYVDSAALMCMSADKQGEPVYEIEEEDFNPFYDGILAARKASQSEF